MSLHALAGHMATKGRGGDSMLVHMTPGEVQALQALAQRHGGTLTINPETGQPEANFLKKILPMVAGFALGPAGFGLMSAGMAGAAVGGITALSTGSLSRGLMAGLGAYGGASLGAGLAGAGAGAAQEAAMAGVGEGASQAALNEAAAKATTDFMGKGMVDRLTEGATAAFNDPKAFVQGMGGMGKLAQTGLAAISPIMADEGVQTTTPKQDTGNIRRFSFDRYGQTYTPQGVFPAAGYTGMAQGGIVALANGGTPPTTLTDEQLFQKTGSWEAAAAARDVQNNALNQYNWAQQAASAPAPTGSAAAQYAAANNIDINQQISNWARANPNASDALIDQQMQQYGISNEDVARALGTSGGSKAMEYNVLAGNQGLAGLNQNINSWLQQNPKATREEAEAAMRGVDLNEADVMRATGMSLAELFAPKPIQNAPATLLPGGVSGGGNTVRNPNGTITTTPNIPGRPEGGFTGMGQVRDAYTQGGGSLGYVNPAPKTMEEFDQRFNKQTGDSLAAYNYLMGKGANPATQQRVGEIARPYSEAIVGIPAAAGRPNQKYIYQNGRYVENPNYAPVTYDTKGNRNAGMTSAEVLKGLNALPDKTDDAAIFDWVGANQITIAQLAAAMGISVGEAQRRMNAAKKKAAGASASTGSNFYDGGGDGAVGGADGTGNAAAAAAASGSSAGASGGPGGTGIGEGGGTGMGGYAQGGKARRMALGGLGALAGGGSTSQYNLGGYSDGGRLLRGPGDGVSDSIPATIGDKQPARLADGEFVVPARIVSELGNGSTEAGARKLYAMMDRVQKARGKTTGKSRVAANTRADKYLPA